MDTKVSVITVCYNAEKTIEQTIKSVLDQTYDNIEYIIVDGKSSDRTMEIVQRYKGKIAKIISESDEGIYDAMNKGIALSTGHIIGILNADDWYENDAVERVVACFEKNDSDIVYGDIRFVWSDDKIEDAPKTKELSELWCSMVVRHPATFVKQEVYQSMGRYDTRYPIAADYEFILRCYTRGVKFSYLPYALTNFRMNGVSNSQGEKCADEARCIQLKYANKSNDRHRIYKTLNENMDEEVFLRVVENEQDIIVKIMTERYRTAADGVIIWGTGVWGKYIFEMLKRAEVPVYAFVDSDTSKWGKSIENVPVVSPEAISSRKNSIIIAIRNPGTVFWENIKKLGISTKRYITINDFKTQVIDWVFQKTILYFFDYGEYFGGAANTLLQQMLLARDAGYQVKAFVSCYESQKVSDEYRYRFEEYGIEWMELDFVTSSHPEDIDIIGVFKCYEKVLPVVMKCRPMLLHSVQINPVVELVSREFKIPHIMNIYQAIPDFFALQYADIFPKYHICDSLCFSRAWEEGLHTESKCIRTVVNDFESKKNIEKKETIDCICVGQITPRKNQLEVIKAFEMALAEGVKGKLWLYGYAQEAYAQKCKEYIIEKNLQNVVFVCGFSFSMKEIYKKADVLICGSTVESYPNVISEALANGLVVISAPVAGVPEVLRDAENGYLTGGYEARDFKKKMLECYEAFQTGKVQGILSNANETFEKVHSKEAVALELVKYYEEIKEKGVKQNLSDVSFFYESFEELLTVYEAHKEEFIDLKFVNTKLWYLHHIKNRLRKSFAENKKIYIWGSGKIGVKVLQMMQLFCREIHIEGIVDSYAKGDCEGYHIVEPPRVLGDAGCIILVAVSNGQQEVMEELKRNGKVYGRDYYLMAPRFW